MDTISRHYRRGVSLPSVFYGWAGKTDEVEEYQADLDNELFQPGLHLRRRVLSP